MVFQIRLNSEMCLPQVRCSTCRLVEELPGLFWLVMGGSTAFSVAFFYVLLGGPILSMECGDRHGSVARSRWIGRAPGGGAPRRAPGRGGFRKRGVQVCGATTTCNGSTCLRREEVSHDRQGR